MNQVSDARLAIACHKAGIVPSLFLSSFCYDIIEKELIEYRNHVVGGDLLLSVTCSDLIPSIIKLIVDHQVTHLELIDYHPTIENSSSRIIELIRNSGIKVYLKLTTYLEKEGYISSFDAILIKGPDSAARVVDTNKKLMERFVDAKLLYPNTPIIVCGGISTSKEIKEYLDAGAEAVSLGTVFALSEESRINMDKKRSLINMRYDDVTKLELKDSQQNAIVFSHIPNKEGNNTVGLRVGRDTADKGLIFIGKGIDNINAIKPVSEIVKELTKDVQI